MWCGAMQCLFATTPICMSGADYRHGTHVIDTEAALEVISKMLASSQLVALDLEALVIKGQQHHGPLSLLQMCTPRGGVCLVDVLTLGKAAIVKHLGPMLTNARTQKLMFDCRADSQSLYEQLGIRCCAEHACPSTMKSLLNRCEGHLKTKSDSRWRQAPSTEL